MAEYVETEETRARIATFGVDYGQGFAIGRPTPVVDLLNELPLLTSATIATRYLADPLGERTSDTGMFQAEFAH